MHNSQHDPSRKDPPVPREPDPASGEERSADSARESPPADSAADTATVAKGSTAELPTEKIVPNDRTNSIAPTAMLSGPMSGTQETLDFVSTGRKAVAVVRTAVGDYEILRELGRGGMGVVYLARHRQLNRDVALKMILAGAHADEGQIQRFLTEARSVARFQHPNIVQIFDIGSRDGLPYFSLEFVDGPSLAEKIRKEKLAARDAAQLTETLARAMQIAHDHGVLHRDLKPGNVLLTSTNIPKISDFGLAKQLQDDDSASTRTGTVMGTPSYMSPEQARGEVRELGPTTDQYSLGAILYELLVGRPPFIGAKPVETILRVLGNEPVAPRQLQPEVPIDLETICLKCLQKDPSRRYASCADLADDLQRFLRGEPIHARPVGVVERFVRWCQRNPKVAIPSGLALAGVLSFAIVSSWAAVAMSSKNAALRLSNEEVRRQAAIAKEKEKEARMQEGIAKHQATIAAANAVEATKQEGIARDRSERLLKHVQQLFVEIRGIDVNQTPRIQPNRDRLMKLTLPVLDEEVIRSLPKEGDAVATNAALRFDVAKGLAAQGLKEQAEQNLLELQKIFEQRMELMQSSDASRNNLALALRELGSLKRELDRDLNASLDFHLRELALVQSMVDDPKQAPDGRGGFEKYQSQNVLAIAHNGVGVTYYRMGDPLKAKSHFETAAGLWNEILNSIDKYPSFTKLSAAQQAAVRGEITTQAVVIGYSLGLVKFRTGAIDEAESMLRQAFEHTSQQYLRDPKNPSQLRNYIGPLGIFAEFLAQNGKLGEAMPLLESAARLAEELLIEAPNNVEFRRTAALAFYRLAQWKAEPTPEEAAKWGKKCLDLRQKMVAAEPTNFRRQLEWLMVLALAGDIKEAEASADKHRAASRPDSEMLVETARALAYCSARAPADARGTLAQKAIDTLSAAAALGYRDYVYLQVEIDLKPLREVPTFQELIKRMRGPSNN